MSVGSSQVGARRMRVLMLTSLTQGNDAQAELNSRHLDGRGAIAVNVIGSPGCGKTTLLEATVDRLGDRMSFAVIEGDVATTRDGERLALLGVPVVQINTRGACHLDAHMTARAMAELEVAPGSVILIENVGNLVCPASFRLGERIRVVMLSATEGSDKAAKYPAAFRGADCVLISKADLLPYVDFAIATVQADLRQIGAEARVIVVSAHTGEGMAEWASWLEGAISLASHCRFGGRQA